ncbi:MAG: coenzyme F420-0:L-glutamate ligase [Candidatus Asgardarchaeia archaeon]
MKLSVIGIHVPMLITPDDNLIDILLDATKKQGLTIDNNDVLVIASSVVSLVEHRFVKKSEISPTDEAKEMGKRFRIDPKLMQLIINESDKIIGGPPGFILTIRMGLPCSNACIDSSNVPQGYYLLPLKDPMKSAKEIRKKIYENTGKKVAVIIADSGILPGKKGTIGVALGFAGIKPVKNYVGKKDLYGRKLKASRQSIVDLLASAAEIVMGEANERIPFVLIKGVNAEFTDEDVSFEENLMDPEDCVYMRNLLKKESN